MNEENEELDKGASLALQLVDHLESMGAAACEIPVIDRAVGYAVIVKPMAQLEEEKLMLADLLVFARHTHVNNGQDDRCKTCERDLRHIIHRRA